MFPSDHAGCSVADAETGKPFVDIADRAGQRALPLTANALILACRCRHPEATSTCAVGSVPATEAGGRFRGTESGP